MVTETDINEDLRTLAQDAENARLYGSPPDAIVLRAIELGMGTRADIRRSTGFGYDVIEKCLERNSGDLSSQMTGEIERFKLRGTDNALKPKVEHICIDCGGPKSSYPSVKRCRKCYESKKAGDVAQNGHKPEKTLHIELGPEEEAAVAAMRDEEEPVGYVTFDGEASPKSDKNITKTITEETCGCGRPRTHMGRCAYRRAQAGGDFPVSKNGQKTVKKETKVRTEIEQPKPVEVVEPDKKQDNINNINITDITRNADMQVIQPADKMTPQQFIERFNSFDDYEIDEFFTKLNEQSTDVGIVWGVLPDEPKHSKQFFSVAYNVLVTMLDDDMAIDEKQSVWTLICYLKKQQKRAYS